MTKSIEELARKQSRLNQTYEQVIELINTEDLESEIDEYAEDLAKELSSDKHTLLAQARLMADQLTKQCRQSRFSSSQSRSFTS